MKNMNHNFKKTYTSSNDISQANTRNKMVRLLITRAVENEVPVHQDRELVNKLARLEALESAPNKYYAAIAEIMTYIHSKDRLMGMGAK